MPLVPRRRVSVAAAALARSKEIDAKPEDDCASFSSASTASLSSDVEAEAPAAGLATERFEQLAEQRVVVSSDGVELNVQVLCGDGGPASLGARKVMLLCAPLGLESMWMYRPIIAQFRDEYDFVSWNYRGMYHSASPKRVRKLSIRDHAEDGMTVLRACDLAKADVVVGHSMGVQVALELTLLYPEAVEALLLMNGAHGHVFSTAFQPGVRLPYVGGIADWIAHKVVSGDAHSTFSTVHWMLQSRPARAFFSGFARVMGSEEWSQASSDDYYNDLVSVYFSGVLRNEDTSDHYCRMFQELDAHSVYHLLDTVQTPALLVSGMLDCLTPAYHMSEMASKMKNAKHVMDWKSSHATIMENPSFLINAAEDFLRKAPVETRFRRCDSAHFARIPSSPQLL